MIDFITSVNAALFELYGRRMVADFGKFSGKGTRLIVVFEGKLPADRGAYGENIVFVPFASPDHQRFLKYFGHLYEAHGFKLQQTFSPDVHHCLAERDYRFDAVRFSFKVFAIEIGQAFLEKANLFAWVDADVRCLRHFECEDLKAFFPAPDELMTYLGRDNFPDPPYSECSFLGFNAAHPKLVSFLKRVREIYLTGEIFSFAQWHDSWIWDEVRREFELMGVRFRSISDEASVTEHPLVNCGLGRFFDHLKGPVRKQLGRSLEKDYISGERLVDWLRTRKSERDGG